MILTVIYLCVLLTGALIGGISYRRLTPPFKYLFLILLITFISESLGIIAGKLWEYNLPLYHVYTPLYFLLQIALYCSIITSKTLQKIIILSGSIIIALSLLNTITNPKDFPSYIILSGSIVIVFYTILAFYQFIRHPPESSLFKSPVLWLNGSMLFYFSTSFIYWCLYHYLTKTNPAFLQKYLYTFMSYLNIAHYSLLGYASYLDATKKDTQHGATQQ